jgi:hypothetical protein
VEAIELQAASRRPLRVRLLRASVFQNAVTIATTPLTAVMATGYIVTGTAG